MFLCEILLFPEMFNFMSTEAFVLTPLTPLTSINFFNFSKNCKISPLLFQKSSDFVHGDAEVEVVSTPQLRKVDGN